VRFIQADLFAWEPDRRYDVVFFGFWLSHVPPGRFEPFWSLVAGCLKPQGRVFFADDAYHSRAGRCCGGATAERLIQVSGRWPRAIRPEAPC
jgi:hypothetical protein